MLSTELVDVGLLSGTGRIREGSSGVGRPANHTCISTYMTYPET